MHFPATFSVAPVSVVISLCLSTLAERKVCMRCFWRWDLSPPFWVGRVTKAWGHLDSGWMVVSVFRLILCHVSDGLGRGKCMSYHK